MGFFFKKNQLRFEGNLVMNIDIHQIEQLVKEYTASTNVQRIKEIGMLFLHFNFHRKTLTPSPETILDNIANSFPSILEFLAIINQGCSPDVHFFVIRIVHQRLIEQWIQFDVGSRGAILEQVLDYILRSFEVSQLQIYKIEFKRINILKRLPHHVLNGALKVIVDIAIRDWPDNIPGFMDNVVALLSVFLACNF